MIGVPVSICILVMVTFSVHLTAREHSNYKDIPVNLITNAKYLGDHIIYDRSSWAGKASLNYVRVLTHPTKFVLISHTGGSFCKTLEECTPIMQTIQSIHVTKYKSPDIGYNFLIAGDGNIYIGRGWDIINFHNVNNIGISFIGNYVFDELTPRMVSALKILLEQGVKLNKLPNDYRLVSHNQTFATLSPGVNVYKEIVKFPNFYNGPINFKKN